MYAGDGNGIAREVIRAYAGDVSGIARLFYEKSSGPAYELSYSGAYTRREVTYGGTVWDEWTCTGSGTLTKSGSDIPGCDVVVISGGGAGQNATDLGNFGTGGGYGGVGGKLTRNNNYTIDGSIAVTVGNGASTNAGSSGASSFGDVNAAAVSSPAGTATSPITNGGTGGGARNGATASPGDGIGKRPFNDSAAWPNVLCPGGGASAHYGMPASGPNPSRNVGGGAGGTNGGSGAIGPASSTSGGLGGATGGGRGGDASTSGDNSTNGTTYGAGGGAKGIYVNLQTSVTNRPAGVRSGYQGVVILRVPLRAA